MASRRLADRLQNQNSRNERLEAFTPKSYSVSLATNKECVIE
jgi:hypothetical protein